MRRIFLPCAKQLLMRERDPSGLAVIGFDGALYNISGLKPLFRMRNARDRNAIHRQQRDKTASDVAKAPERLDMRDLRVKDIAGTQGRHLFFIAFQLRRTPR